MNQRSIRIAAKLAGASVLALTAHSAFANVEVLNFAGLDQLNNEAVLDYYNGGAGSLGSTGGPNYGISFGPDAITCAGQPGGNCNTAEVPGGPGAGLIYFVSGTGDIMNVAAGFTTGFSFFYTSPFNTGSVNVYSGLNGTGTLLATLTLPLTPNNSGSDPNCLGEPYCPYVPVGVTFSGMAESVDFSGTSNGIGFADITLGSQTAGNVPEPSSLGLMLLGLGVAGTMARRRSTRQDKA